MRVATVALLLALTGCGDSSTVLTIELESDLAVPNELDRLCVTARPDGALPLVEGYDSRGADLGDNLLPGLPGTLAYVDSKDRFDLLVVTATGTGLGLPAGSGSGRFTLADREQREVKLRVRACAPTRTTSIALSSIGSLPPTNAVPRRAVLADLDADGRAELIEAPARVVVLSSSQSQDVSGNFLRAPPLGAAWLTAADLDHDCAPDLAMASIGSAMAPLVSAPDDLPPFGVRDADASRIDWPAGAGGAIAAGDLDGSGTTDLFLAGDRSYRILLSTVSNGSAELGEDRAGLTLEGGPEDLDGVGTSVAIADITGDHQLDLIVGHAGSEDFHHAVRVFQGRPDTLEEIGDALVVPAEEGRDVSAVAIGPLDGDDTPDVLVVFAGPGGPCARLYSHVDDPLEPRFGLAAAVQFPDGDGQDVTLVDLDGDCDLDVVIAVSGEPSRVFEQTPDGLEAVDLVLPSALAVTSAITDLDLDGSAEVVVVLLDAAGGGEIWGT